MFPFVHSVPSLFFPPAVLMAETGITVIMWRDPGVASGVALVESSSDRNKYMYFSYLWGQDCQNPIPVVGFTV